MSFKQKKAYRDYPEYTWKNFFQQIFNFSLNLSLVQLQPSTLCLLKSNVYLNLVICPKHKNSVVQFLNFLCLSVCLSGRLLQSPEISQEYSHTHLQETQFFVWRNSDFTTLNTLFDKQCLFSRFLFTPNVYSNLLI